MICLATFIVIGADSKLLNSGLFFKTFRLCREYIIFFILGSLAYFSFLSNGFAGGYASETVPLIWRVSALILSFVLAIILHTQVEQRFRYSSTKNKRKNSIVLIAASAVVLMVSYIPNPFLKADVDYAFMLRESPGLSFKCTYGGNEFIPNDECITQSPPKVIVWGDSYAMHLMSGLAATMPDDIGLIQATKASCGPFVGIAPVESIKVPEAWAKGCVEFNYTVLKYIKTSPSIETVVLSSPLNMHLDEKSEIYSVSDFDKGDKAETLLNSMNATVDLLRSYGKKIVIVSPPPRNGSDIVRCLTSREILVVSFNKQKSCDISKDSYQEFSKKELGVLNEINHSHNVPVMYLDRYMCDDSVCISTIDNVFMYKDTGHLTVDGSIKLFKKTSLTNDILNEAS